jgi:hypothetical protein
MAYRVDPWGDRIAMFRLWLWEQIALSSVIGIAFACVMVVVFKALWVPRAVLTNRCRLRATGSKVETVDSLTPRREARKEE